jgi:hypothetical protein
MARSKNHLKKTPKITRKIEAIRRFFKNGVKGKPSPSGQFFSSHYLLCFVLLVIAMKKRHLFRKETFEKYLTTTPFGKSFKKRNNFILSPTLSHRIFTIGSSSKVAHVDVRMGKEHVYCPSSISNNKASKNSMKNYFGILLADKFH